jgi:hypothetical protein
MMITKSKMQVTGVAGFENLAARPTAVARWEASR